MASTTVFVFPGQGSQIPGMGKTLYAAFTAAREVYQEVDDALGEKLSKLMFEGPEDILTLTENAQPAIMAASIAAFRVLQKETGLNLQEKAAFVAGHSLGEYSALCAAGTFTLADTARLLRTRGLAMQKATPTGEGAMAALIGLDFAAAEEVAKEAAMGEVCVVANDNAPGQVVISGHKAAIDRAMEIAKTKGAKRALPLAVSAPFHSPLMRPAADVMQEALGQVAMKTPAVPLIANVTAGEVFDPALIKELLVRQVTGQVRWRESVEFMAGKGITHSVEVGTGKVLSGLIKRIAPDIASSNVGEPADVEAFAKASFSH